MTQASSWLARSGVTTVNPDDAPNTLLNSSRMGSSA
jgi:hypothetical protein